MMLTDHHLVEIVDWNNSGEAFPGVQIKGGICYFLWKRDHKGECQITRISEGISTEQASRDLAEFDVLIRDERALSILRKVLAKREQSIIDLISGDTPFGIATNFPDWAGKPSNGDVALHLISNTKRTIGYMKRTAIKKNADAIDSWKVLLPEAYGAGESFPHQILGKLIVARPPSACSQSYIIVYPFTSENEASSFASYYTTRFFRFFVSLRKITQHALRSTYTWVPKQSWDHLWTDEALYKKYGITEDEIAFINSMIRPMGDTDE
jgi:site-specific DNA-methyltransferase (adenine-specific)